MFKKFITQIAPVYAVKGHDVKFIRDYLEKRKIDNYTLQKLANRT